ncbi:MAG: hydrolase, partial [Halobacteriota archaeon]
ISPVKRAATGVDRFVKEFERDEMQRRIYRPKLIPVAWQPEMRMFTEDEFASKVTVDGHVRHTTSDTITASYNQDRYNPVDGELVKVADDLAAFMEAYLALQNGISNAQLRTAVQEKKRFYRKKTIAGISFDKVYQGFH